jgi:arylsulfatase A-like enzyme
MKFSGLLVLFLSSVVLAADAPRPNVLLILADDMGFSDIGCYGSEIHTPNIDALAANGLRFTQFYNTSRCCPTRASLLTGLYSHRAGIGHMVEDRGLPGYIGRLNERCATVAELLKPAGYRTYMVGKWHVGSKEEYWPRKRGFDRFYGQVTGGGNYFTRKTDRMFVLDDAPYVGDDEPGYYKTDDFTNYALKFLDENAAANAPFYMHLCYTAPHWPLQAPEKDIQKYLNVYTAGWDAIRAARHARQTKLKLFESSVSLSERTEQAKAWADIPEEKRADWARRMAVHAAMVEIMDRNIGRVIEKLKALKQFDNTLILFLSDNGASAEVIDGKGKNSDSAVIGTKESYASFHQPWANAANTPFRYWKSIVHEGGISTPLVAHWPGHVAPGRIDAQPAHVIDIVPTVLELAGTTYPANLNGRALAPVDGKSFAAVLAGKTRAQPPLSWEHEGNRAIRKDNWKLVAQRGTKWELYDLNGDRAEMNDLAAKEPQRVKELAALWDAWAKDVGVDNGPPNAKKAKNAKSDDKD